MYTVEEFDKEKTKVMNYIMYKKRSEYEVKNKFKNTIQNELLCDIITYVKDAGYLNDENYINKAVQEYMALKDISIKEIEYKLLTKGIEKRQIEDYISKNSEMLKELEEHELKSASNIVEKKQKTMDKEDIKIYLLRKGYKEETIKEVL